MTTAITLRRYLALADCVLVDSFGRTYRILKGRGGFFDPAGAAPLIQEGKLEEVPERRNPPGGLQLPTSFSRRGWT
jgi:hypothetical protein